MQADGPLAGKDIMAGTRKTLDREALLRPLNAALASDAYGTVGRRTVALVAEAALLDSNSYRGFRYLPSELDADGRLLPGYDDTRRQYF
jgi:hypothetical protein